MVDHCNQKLVFLCPPTTYDRNRLALSALHVTLELEEPNQLCAWPFYGPALFLWRNMNAAFNRTKSAQKSLKRLGPAGDRQRFRNPSRARCPLSADRVRFRNPFFLRRAAQTEIQKKQEICPSPATPPHRILGTKSAAFRPCHAPRITRLTMHKFAQSVRHTWCRMRTRLRHSLPERRDAPPRLSTIPHRHRLARSHTWATGLRCTTRGSPNLPGA